MVRLDKIIYMITHFKSLTGDLEESQYSSPNEDIIIDDNVLRVMSRFGVISKEFHDVLIQEKLLNSIPFGRESFLLSNAETHSLEVCKTDSPNCSSCDITDQCDYYNSKNMWMDKENI